MSGFPLTTRGPQTAADWTTQNPNLAQFEMGAESDTGKVKVNFSSTPTAWNDLSYLNATAVKATGAEVNTGTDDAKFVTAKAIKDSNYTKAGGAIVTADSTARLALTGLAIGAQVYQTDTGFFYTLINPAAPSSAASWLATPKKYVALLTQTGTNAPVATVLENTLGGTVVWSYDDVGSYMATLTGAFTTGKTITQGNFLGATKGSFYRVTHTSANALTVESCANNEDGTYAGSNDLLSDSSFVVYVYP